jgi:hypothetical protein
VNGEAAVRYLASAGRISDLAYWLEQLPKVKNLDWMMIKWAADVKKIKGA